ncbi:MAG: hypothetical protein K9N21_02725 [Deltaproteobacteria bacterium]|nr:hypothetical protein [Deltaproteobacteria bacterium]
MEDKQVERDVTFDQSEKGRIIGNDEDLYHTLGDLADYMKLVSELAGEVRTDHDQARLDAIGLMADKAYEDLANGMVYVSEKSEAFA